MKKQKQHSHENKQPQQPEAIFHLLPFLAPGVAPATGKGAEALLKYIQSPDAIVVQVFDSKQVADRHVIDFRVTNNTPHGVYLESAVLQEPKDEAEIKASREPGVRGPGVSFDDVPRAAPPVPLFPVLLKPTDEMFFSVAFPLGDKKRKLKWDTAGRLELTISRLDQSKSEKKSVPFLIRWNEGTEA